MRRFYLLAVCVLALAGYLACGGGDGPTVQLSIYPETITQGESATLTWKVENADSVSIDGMPGVTSMTGVIEVFPNETTTYVVRASGDGTTVTAMATVTVIPLVIPPPPPPQPPPIYSVQINATWGLPTQYADGTAIPSADQARIVVDLYMQTGSGVFDNSAIPVATSAAGATSLTFGPVDVQHGVTYYFSAKCRLDGQASEFAETVPHVWMSQP